MQDIVEGKVTRDEPSWVVLTRLGGQERRGEYHAKLVGGRHHVNVPRTGNRPAGELIAKEVSNNGTPVHPLASLPKPELPALHPLPDNGLASHAAGYVYVNIDDTWQGKRDANRVLQANNKFPNMKALADYVHGK